VWSRQYSTPAAFAARRIASAFMKLGRAPTTIRRSVTVAFEHRRPYGK
jgi:hypothetical protein